MSRVLAKPSTVGVADCLTLMNMLHIPDICPPKGLFVLDWVDGLLLAGSILLRASPIRGSCLQTACIVIYTVRFLLSVKLSAVASKQRECQAYIEQCVVSYSDQLRITVHCTDRKETYFSLSRVCEPSSAHVNSREPLLP